MGEKLQISLDYRDSISAHLLQEYKISEYRILSQSLDARVRFSQSKRLAPRYIYQIELPPYASEIFNFPQVQVKKNSNLPVIVGAGPCGLFCALRLLKYGLPSIIIERGSHGRDRMLKIAQFWRQGLLDPETNVCFGAGGAGLFSDGKLKTRIKSPHIAFVMQTLVDLGAPKEMAYLGDPHLGSNKMRELIDKIVEFLKSKGCQLRFDTKVTDIHFNGEQVQGVDLSDGSHLETSCVVLATGHSARDVYQMLEKYDVPMQVKPFSLGVRLEHYRQDVDRLQWGPFYETDMPGARYQMSHHNKQTGRGTYSFCMCPGGYVLSSGTEKDGLVTNGMSNFQKSSPWSNAGIVVSVAPESIQEGLRLQQDIEQKALMLNPDLDCPQKSKMLPALSLQEFLQEKMDSKRELNPTSSPSKIYKAPIYQIFPQDVVKHLKDALMQFERKLPGFSQKALHLIAPETRTSAPLQVLRDPQTFQSIKFKGLYPGGEGAGQAGGITSAACDGVNIADKIIQNSFL